jgi:hypothetical protein
MARFAQKIDLPFAKFLDPGGIEYLKKTARMRDLFEDVPGTFLGRDPKGLDRCKGHQPGLLRLVFGQFSLPCLREGNFDLIPP